MSDQITKVISSKPVLSAKLFSVDEVQLILPNGKEVTHHVVHRLPTVVIFPITDSHEIYLVSEYRAMLGKTILSAAAGFMDKDGEKPLDTAKREAKEELGIAASQWEFLTKIEMASSVVNGQANLFMARDLEIGSNNLEEDEQIEVVKMSLDEAVKKIMANEISNSATMVGILMLDRLKREGKL